MTILILEDQSVKNSRICELFGLSNSGKSTYARELISKNYNCSMPHEGGNLKKLILFFKFLLKHPVNTSKIFVKMNSNWVFLDHLSLLEYIRIFYMRNSYMAAVLARYEEIKKDGNPICVDEFFLQSLFMVFQVKTNEEEISKIIRLFPRSWRSILIEINRETRYLRLNKSGFPGQRIDKKYAEIWMENSESNYGLIKKILLDRCKIVQRFD